MKAVLRQSSEAQNEATSDYDLDEVLANPREEQDDALLPTHNYSRQYAGGGGGKWDNYAKDEEHGQRHEESEIDRYDRFAQGEQQKTLTGIWAIALKILMCDHGEEDRKPITGWGPLDIWRSVWRILSSSWLSLLLLCFPFSLLSKYLHWNDGFTFTFSMLTMIPLAWLLGDATEELALKTNVTIGGFLNATFGNAVELIVAILALKEGLLRVVQASLLGSILSNSLLVLGSAFFLGGLKYKEQQFNSAGAKTVSSMLMLAVLTLSIPATYMGITSWDADKEEKEILHVSHISAIVLFVMYLCFLLFQLKTHQHLFLSDDDDEEDEPTMTLFGALFLLALTTAIVSLEAEFVVDSIERVAESWGLSDTFIGIILLPIAGNAAEHVTAIKVAMNNKMDLTLGVVVGSSTQIAVLVVPVLVLLGWIIGQKLTLYFELLQTVIMALSVLIVNIVVGNGRSNWLEGALLLAAYFVIAVAFFFDK